MTTSGAWVAAIADAGPAMLLFERPSTVDEVFAFITELADRPTARIVAPGPEHMGIFERLCRDAGAAGKLVADAQHAAVAIEHGCTLVSTDTDFARSPDLRWRHPLRRPTTVHESSGDPVRDCV